MSKMEDRKLLLKRNEPRYVEKAGKKQIIPIKKCFRFEWRCWRYVLCCYWCACCFCEGCDNDFNSEEEYKAHCQFKAETQEGYEEMNEKHEALLKTLYDKGQECFSEMQKKNEIPWKVYGFTSNSPREDLRGAGVHSLQFMIYFIENFPKELNELFQLEQVSFVLVSDSITFCLRCFLLLEKGTSTSPITRKQLKCFLFNLVRNPELLFEIESEILKYYKRKLQSVNAQRINEMDVKTNMTKKLIDDSIAICGKALDCPADSRDSFVNQFRSLLINEDKEEQ